jgi:hypothetical protein
MTTPKEQLTPKIIQEIVKHIGNDGHNLYGPENCEKWKVPKWVWENQMRRHQSGSGKHQLYMNGNPVPHIDGLYALDLLRSLHAALDLEDIADVIGRGTEATLLTEKLTEWIASQ